MTMRQTDPQKRTSKSVAKALFHSPPVFEAMAMIGFILALSLVA